MNADVYADTQSGTPLSTNMFAYCENNSTNSCDPTGYYTSSLVLGSSMVYKLSSALYSIIMSISASMASIKTAIVTSFCVLICVAAVAIAIIGIVHLVRQVKSISSSAARVVSSVKSKIKHGGVKPKKGTHTVYAITRKRTYDVVYVGRTCNFGRRKSQHQRKKFPASKYTMYAVATGLSLAKARALEQTLITAYGLDTLKNMINSISPKKWGNFKTEFNQMKTLIESYYDPE